MDTMNPSALSRRTAMLGLAGLTLTGGSTAAAVNPATVPEPKRSKPGLYLEAKDMPAFIDANGGSTKVLFLDVRTRAEAMFVGMPTTVDALVPFVEVQELMSDWDMQRGAYKLEPMQEFVPEVLRRLQAKQLTKADTVVLMCRSGDRSGRAATRLAEDGYTKVYSVVDGFEGDLSAEGRRDVNGWRKAGLPWSYKLDKAKMYFAH